MAVAIDVQVTAPGVDPARLAALAEAAALAELGAAVELSLVLTGDEGIAALHEEWLGVEGPTDVISFPQLALRPGDAVPEGALLGDVVISVETAARQAAGYPGWSVADEVALLAVHGLLHLCGYDDRAEPAWAAMRRREDELLAAAGIGPAPRGESHDVP